MNNPTNHLRDPEIVIEPMIEALCRSVVHKYPYENAENIEVIFESLRGDLNKLDHEVKERYLARVKKWEQDHLDEAKEEHPQ